MTVLQNKTILITGGTGSFGKAFSLIVLKKLKPKKLIIYSRDEFKQFEMKQQFAQYKNIRFFIGDVRDKERLERSLDGVDFVVHTAALKQVPAMEYNPSEAVKTNVIGAINVIEACLNRKVKKVIALSTDKACNPINLYGATKLCSDKLFVAANAYSGIDGTRFGVVRYGNVVGSRGSVIPYFEKHKKNSFVPVTHPEMTRFWITLEQAVNFVIQSFVMLKGGEIFVPKIPSMKIIDLAKAICPQKTIKIIGIRPGEKLHELMISRDNARNTKELSNTFVIIPAFPWWDQTNHPEAKKVPENFEYASDKNRQWLTPAELKKLLRTKL